MIFGNKESFAVECEFTSQIERWVYGTFRVWVGGCPIGTYSEEVLNLNGTTEKLREPVQEASLLAANLSAGRFLERTLAPTYGAGPYNHAEWQEWGRFAWLAYHAGFEKVFSAVSKVGNNVRVVWRLSGGEPVMEHFRVFGVFCG